MAVNLVAAYYVRYKGWKRPQELIYHSKASAEVKRAYLERHGVKCKMGPCETKKQK